MLTQLTQNQKSSRATRVLQRKCACTNGRDMGDCPECEKKKRRLQRKPLAPLGSTAIDRVTSNTESRFGTSLVSVPVSRPSGNVLQPKLTISEPGDRYECEADSIADLVMRRNASENGHASDRISVASSRLPKISRLHTDLSPPSFTDLGQTLDDSHRSAIPVTGGHSLPKQTRTLFENRFGHDFASVRIHTDTTAGDSAKSFQARAYTAGSHIVFGAGEYQPDSPSGQHLLAHELTHVVQQTGGRPIGRSVDGSSDVPSVHSGPSHGPLSSPVQASAMPCPAVQRIGLPISAADLVGGGWLALPDSLKARFINRAIDAALSLIDAFPGRYLVGSAWIFMKEGLTAFYTRLKSAKDSVKIQVMDTMARIMTGQSFEYMKAFVIGLVKGFFVDGLAGIFIAIWDLAKGLSHLWDFFGAVGRMIGSFPDQLQNIIDGAKELGLELVENLGPAIEEVKTFLLDPANASRLLEMIAEKGRGYAQQAGNKIADVFLDFFSRPGADAAVGGAAGRVTGMVLWEVVFAVLTGGAGAAATGVKAAARFVARLSARIAGSILRVFRHLVRHFGKVIDAVRSAATFVKGKVLAPLARRFEGLLERIREFSNTILRHCHESKLVCDLPTTGKVAEGQRPRRTTRLHSGAGVRYRVSGPHHRLSGTSVYVLNDASGNVLYVGKGGALDRLRAHIRDPKKTQWFGEIHTVEVRGTALSNSEALALEQSLIGELVPFYNIDRTPFFSTFGNTMALGPNIPRAQQTLRFLVEWGH